MEKCLLRHEKTSLTRDGASDQATHDVTLHAAVAEMQQERGIAREAVDLGADQAGAADLGAADGAPKLGAVVPLATLNLGNLLQQASAVQALVAPADEECICRAGGSSVISPS
jgi:hypothetical protein